MRKPFIVVTRRLATRAIKKRPVSVRTASVRAFPIVFDTIVNTHYIRTSVTGFVELEVALLSFEIALIMGSVASKKLSKNDLNSEDP
jgi:hypothetical protein